MANKPVPRSSIVAGSGTVVVMLAPVLSPTLTLSACVAVEQAKLRMARVTNVKRLALRKRTI